MVLHCNLGHELLQLGDCDAALVHLDEGPRRCRRLANPRLLAAVLINRVIALSELGRAADALRDIDEICELPADEAGARPQRRLLRIPGAGGGARQPTKWSVVDS